MFPEQKISFYNTIIPQINESILKNNELKNINRNRMTPQDQELNRHALETEEIYTFDSFVRENNPFNLDY